MVKLCSFLRVLSVPITGIILLLPGCKTPSYSLKPLQEAPSINTHTQTKDNVTLSVKQLTPNETKKLFDGRASRLLNKRKPIYPLHISIRNDSDHAILLDPTQIGLKLATPAIVAQRLYSHTARRIIAPLIVGMIGLGATFLGGVYLIILGAIPAAGMPALVKVGYCTLGLSSIFGLGSPAISYYQGHHAKAVNRTIEEDVLEKTIHQPVSIAANSSYSGLIFIQRRSYHSAFSITVVDQETQKPLSFDIELTKGERS